MRGGRVGEASGTVTTNDGTKALKLAHRGGSIYTRAPPAKQVRHVAIDQAPKTSHSKVTPQDAARFPSETLFDRVGRVLCALDCLPRKELFEAWEVARRVRRRFRGGRVVDLACGHGLVAHLMLILDDTSPGTWALLRAAPAGSSERHHTSVRRPDSASPRDTCSARTRNPVMGGKSSSWHRTTTSTGRPPGPGLSPCIISRSPVPRDPTRVAVRFGRRP